LRPGRDVGDAKVVVANVGDEFPVGAEFRSLFPAWRRRQTKGGRAVDRRDVQIVPVFDEVGGFLRIRGANARGGFGRIRRSNGVKLRERFANIARPLNDTGSPSLSLPFDE